MGLPRQLQILDLSTVHGSRPRKTCGVRHKPANAVELEPGHHDATADRCQSASLLRVVSLVSLAKSFCDRLAVVTHDFICAGRLMSVAPAGVTLNLISRQLDGKTAGARYHVRSRRTGSAPCDLMVLDSAAGVARTTPCGSCSTVALWPSTRRVSSTISPLANSNAS